MKLDYDCIRDILFTVEETTTLEQGCYINQAYTEHHRLKKYDINVLKYHVRQCALNDYFTEASFDFENNCIIADLSPKGHEYIAAIRSENVWNKTKEIIGKIGGVALSTIPDIVNPIISAQIKSFLNGV